NDGALAFFVEKYPDQVTVYTIGTNPSTSWISKELCGGPHVENTSQIPAIEVYKEQASSSGVRRLYFRQK
ncbi:MAG: alanine--tRNA ligase, partial [Microgenomates group bacterium]